MIKEICGPQARVLILLPLFLLAPLAVATEAVTIGEYTLAPGHSSLEIWTLPEPSHPANNKPTKERITLGETLFFDVRLSGSGEMSCASCHIPTLGWADGLATAKGANGKKLRRATPTIINSAYNFLQMWDGRFESLETQVAGPLTNVDEMNMPLDRLFKLLKNDKQYSAMFANAYPGQEINLDSIGKAIAAFERTVISADSSFDRWVRGEQSAMTEAQVKGFEVFLDPTKGNCVACHSPPNFTDDGYHNIGLDPFEENPDYGRFNLVPIGIMKGAFKTPTLRDIQSTHPYFHDGSAQTLMDVMEHYESIDNTLTAVSPSLTHARMTSSERESLLAFLSALTDRQRIETQASDCPVSVKSTATNNNPTPSQ